MKKLEFVRFGGLSPVNHKQFYKQESFHSPPRKKGIYAFIFPYIEDFLWSWKIKGDDEWKVNHNKYHRRNRRQFAYDGDIWCHFVKEAREQRCAIEYKKDWVKVHTDDLRKLLKIVKQSDRIQLNEDYNIGSHENIHDPYKRGLGGFMSKDHLEVFVKRVK